MSNMLAQPHRSGPLDRVKRDFSISGGKAARHRSAMIVMWVDNQNERRSLQMNTTTVGVDLARQRISLCLMDGHGRVLGAREFRLHAFGAWLVQCTAGVFG